MTKSELRVLKVLSETAEALYSGSLGALTGLEFDSRVFTRLEKQGLIIGHPYEITQKGTAALALSRSGEG